MATTMNNYFDRVKLLEADSLTALETAINNYITGDDSGLESGEYVTSINLEIGTASDAPGVNHYVAVLCINGSTTTD